MVTRVGTDEIEHRLDALVAELLELHRRRRRGVSGPDAA
jgi:hypothetical protein